MTKLQRAENIVSGLIMILCGIALVYYPEDGFPIITTIISISLILTGLRFLVYYYLMARYMVGGRNMLYIGVIVLDFGLFTFSMADEHGIILITYMIGLHAFYGLLNLVKGVREKIGNVPLWKIDAAQGTVNLLVAGASAAFLHSIRVIVGLYCAGLFYSAAARIISAFRKTEIVYIQ